MKLNDYDFNNFLLAYKVALQSRANKNPKPQEYSFNRYTKYLEGKVVADKLVKLITPKQMESIYLKALSQVKKEYIKPLYNIHLGTSQKDMAAKIGVNRKTLQRYEAKFKWAFIRLINEKLNNGSTRIN